jgi:hypothetical protein
LPLGGVFFTPPSLFFKVFAKESEVKNTSDSNKGSYAKLSLKRAYTTRKLLWR